jgi:retinol dehydrogenase 14
MNGRFCLITGANSGIGRQTAIELARLGATLVIVCRNRERGEPALREIREQSGNESVELMLADFSSQDAIRELARAYEQTHQRLHVLVNNAGVILRKRHLTVDGLEATFAINHLAYFLLTNLLLPLIRKSAPARIVNVASAVHASGMVDFDDLQSERNYGSMRAYGQSKLGNVLFTYELARRLEGSGVTANCLHPGVIATGIARDFPAAIRGPVRVFSRSVGKGAETSIHLAASPEVEGVSGKYFVDKKQVESSESSRDREIAHRLWQVSEDLTSGSAGCPACGSQLAGE